MRSQYKGTGNGGSRSGHQKGNNEIRVLHDWKFGLLCLLLLVCNSAFMNTI
jgi:hypothetical protein